MIGLVTETAFRQKHLPHVPQKPVLSFSHFTHFLMSDATLPMKDTGPVKASSSYRPLALRQGRGGTTLLMLLCLPTWQVYPP